MLINNAAVSYFGLLSEMDPADWHRMIDTAMNARLSAKEAEALRQEIPADRIGKPEEAAELLW